MTDHLEDNSLAIEATNFTYTFSGTNKFGLENVSLALEWGTFNLLVGPNGAGKSTLLKILAGKTLIKAGSIKLGGFDPFSDNRTRSQQHNSDINQYITYLGTEWATNSMVKRDISVKVLISSIGGDVYPERRDRLIDILDFDPEWSMLNLSDGERRRVQIAMGLVRPWRLLLIDEVTIDLDVIVRQKLLNYLKEECNDRRCTVVYATHIFDGIDRSCYDRIIHLSEGAIVDNYETKDIIYDQTLQEKVQLGSQVRVKPTESLYPLATRWLSDDLSLRGTRDDEKAKMAKRHSAWENKGPNDNRFLDGNDERLKQYFKSTRSHK
ncbi:P-loop containing nucleoside triphosphate hydrolase protein [Suhomyces tanzawaensis NRRL Y-17324]|uniref:p-loop containing nucleoside triphosphate hydrolase protein n=1 Tax=Suhomyces tanzawaensis NRRL Y-17324 TaxID=984487 RepID=A0A1E4SN61_9ASCO|nr:P-loop containing nucleoside triphosphate hydrolase protein [Suhomyces tanzawaensis NRRL Y-17324]ODV80964.1 P-loop containing nucleoside triphosphate hydrolase protein [Suhomyces tanzawaensis NRRL Y-17324]